MTRLVYGALVRLHPPAFRRDFGDQMLCIFEEASAEEIPAVSLWADALVSLTRQWFLRCGLWKAGVAILVSALLFAAFPLWRHAVRSWEIPEQSGPEAAIDDLMKITLTALGFISVILVSIVSWSRVVTSRRSASCHWNYARSRSATAGFPQSKT